MIFVHTLGALLSYVAFLIAFASGLLFLIQERQVKRKTMGILFRFLPSLELLDQVNCWALGIGFWLLTIGVFFGLLETRALLGRWWLWDPKACFALLLWAAYLILWIARLRTTLRGHRVALLSIVGFSLVLFLFIGISHLLPSLYPFLRTMRG